MTDIPPLLLCCDLDRTLLPNGVQPESAAARPLFRHLSDVLPVVRAYVSGRDLSLLQEAIREYGLPLPDYAVGDVGSTVYRVEQEQWLTVPEWSGQIAGDWGGHSHGELRDWCADIDGLVLQEPEKQNAFKLSYYTAPDIDRAALRAGIDARLRRHDVRAAIIWSLDEAAGKGLLDILPAAATKLHAVQFLMENTGIGRERSLFAGDSGNDLPVLVSSLNSVLVANAPDDVRREAVTTLEQAGRLESLYAARGGFLGMNGNYAAGVLEGLAHFFPETAAPMETLYRRIAAT